ncbi:uncharacterized protein [Hemitrygon akajei]|uniref:uncharacterized protein isoform X2 n=1 Tax=Hemitrygon akajei TaxID=2704970 RepID=UPI003BF94C4C
MWVPILLIGLLPAEQTTTQSSSTVEKSKNEENHQGKRNVFKVVLTVTVVLLLVFFICLICYIKNKYKQFKWNVFHREGKNETQEVPPLEGSTIYANVMQLQNRGSDVQQSKSGNEIVYATVQHQKDSRAGHSINNQDKTTYAYIRF